MSGGLTLVAHTGGIGDLLLTAPAIELLAREGPVEALGETGRLELLREGRIIRAAHGMDSVRFDSVFSHPAPEFADFARRFERVIVFMRDDGVIRGAFEQAGARDVRTFAGLPPQGWRRHASRYYLTCLGFHGVSGPFYLRIPPSPREFDVILHPGSGGESKNWPMENFVRLAQMLEERGRRVTWLLGPAEEGVAVPCGSEVLEGLPLIEAARVYAAARLSIGNDSGMSHLAAAVGCPALVLFGPTDPRVWAPRGERVVVLRGKPWPSPDEALRTVHALTPAGRDPVSSRHEE